MILFFDTETTDKINKHKPLDDASQPRIVSVAYAAYTDDGKDEVVAAQTLVKPVGFTIPEEVIRIHGITNERAAEFGIDVRVALSPLLHLMAQAKYVCTFNAQFDMQMLAIESAHYPEYVVLPPSVRPRVRCVMLAASAAMKIPNTHGYEGYAWPKLSDAYEWIYKTKFEGAHNSMNDTRAAAWLAFGLIQGGMWHIETEC